MVNFKKLSYALIPISGIGIVLNQYNKNQLYDNNTIDYDIGVIGGGIIGSAVARQLSLEHKNKKIIILEKDTIASGQTGHNSGVIHAGIYYKPNSLKAKLCVKGNRAIYDYCDKNNISYNKIGKLIVSTNEEENKTLLELYNRAQKNGAIVELLNSNNEIQKIQPGCNGNMAIWSPNTGIIDYKNLAKSFVNDFILNNKKNKILENSIVLNITSINNDSKDFKDGIKIIYSNNNMLDKFFNKKSINVKCLVSCAGLHCDTIANMTTTQNNKILETKIVPVRGEYLILKPTSTLNIKTNIYPVPDETYPFLGVHFTPTLDGKILLGPNAVLALSKEGYSYYDINLIDIFEYLKFSGFHNLVTKHWRYGLAEFYSSIFVHKKIKELQKFIPELKKSDIDNIYYSGVRSQAVDKNGNLIEDFIFDINSDNKIFHVINAPSPGATSSMAIAEMIVEKFNSEISIK